MRARLLLVELGLELLHSNGFLERFAHLQRHARGLHMYAQIVGATVCAAHTLNPAVGVEQFAVPAVGGVVRHFVLHVLAEAQLCHVDANLLHEQHDAHEEVAERFVVDELRVDCFADGDDCRFGAAGGLCLA